MSPGRIFQRTWLTTFAPENERAAPDPQAMGRVRSHISSGREESAEHRRMPQWDHGLE